MEHLEVTAEQHVRELYAYACRGAESVLSACPDPSEALKSPEKRRSVFCAAHRGFHDAQERIVEGLIDSSRSEALRRVYRKIMDAMAWQMLDKQLYVARLLFKTQVQPSLLHSNLASVRRAAASLTSSDYARFALLSDLTSFVQLGDILIFDPDAGLSIAEVKEGKTNKRILEFAHAFMEAPSERSMEHFYRVEGPKTYEQLGRVLRQGARLEHVEELLNTGRSYDPDVERETRVLDTVLPIDSYDLELAAILEKSKAYGWAIDQLQGCLFLGAYRGNAQVLGRSIFAAWFSDCGGKPGFPLVDLMTCMQIPLALPIFLRHLPREDKFDLLFRRASLFLALDVDGFIALCRSKDLPVRWSTKKETAKLLQQKHEELRPWIAGKRALVLEKDGHLKSITDGLFLRMFFHGASPKSCVEIIRRLSEFESDAAPE